MSRDKYVLAIDLGTGGPKTALVSMRGEVAGHELILVETRHLADGGVVQDPNEWWSAITSSARKLIASGVVPPADIVAVACTGQWASTIPVAADGELAGDCVLWMDNRGEPYSAKVVGGLIQVGGYAPLKALRWIRKSGGAPSPLGNDPTGQILHLRHDEPDVYARAAVFLEPVDYLNMRFTGRIAATPVSMVVHWLTDNRDLTTTRYDPELVRMSTMDPAKLPPLQAVASVVGIVSPDVASDLGLANGVQVVTGTPDLHSAAIGSGAIGDYEPHLAISTTSWISCHVPFKKTDAMKQIATIPSVIPGRYLLANNHETAGVCLQWLRDNVVVQDDGLIDGGAVGRRLSCLRPTRRDGARRERRRRLHALARRRALPGRRPQRARRVLQPLPANDARAHGARRVRGRGLQRALDARRGREVREAAARRRSASSAAARRRTSGARSTPTC